VDLKFFLFRKSKLNEFECKLGIPSVHRNKLAAEEVAQPVIDEVEKDVMV